MYLFFEALFEVNSSSVAVDEGKEAQTKQSLSDIRYNNNILILSSKSNQTI